MAEHDADVRNEHEDEREDGEPNLNVEVAHVVTDVSRASRCVNYLQDAVDALGAAAANTVNVRSADPFQTALEYLTEMHVAAAADLASAMAAQERLVSEYRQPEAEEPCHAVTALEDGDELEDGEHLCDLPREHHGPHHCYCRYEWSDPQPEPEPDPGLEPPIEERPECGERRPGVPHCRCGKPRGHEGPHSCRASACSRGDWEDDDPHSQLMADACDQALADDEGLTHYCHREPRHEGRHACRCGEVWVGWHEEAPLEAPEQPQPLSGIESIPSLARLLALVRSSAAVARATANPELMNQIAEEAEGMFQRMQERLQGDQG